MNREETDDKVHITFDLRSLGEGGRAAEQGVTRARLEEMRESIEQDIRKFRALLGGASAKPPREGVGPMDPPVAWRPASHQTV